MAVAAVAGLASGVGGALACRVLRLGTFAAATAFAIGAGLSVVSRALMPTPSMGTHRCRATL